jgi:ABC-type amino acid transport substrate-binding protein
MRANRVLAAVSLAFTILGAASEPGDAASPASGDLQIRVVVRDTGAGKFASPAGTEPPGFDVDLLRRFAAWYRLRTGQEVRFEMAYASTIPAMLESVQKGSADLGLGGVTETLERSRLVDFSLATLPVRSVLVTLPGVLDAARWRQQLPGLRLGAIVGSTNAAEVDRIAAATPGVKVNTSFTTHDALFSALAANPRELDAAVVDMPQYWTGGKQKGLAVIDSVGQPHNLAFALRKGSPLKGQLDEFLGGFTHSSDYYLLIRRYFGQDAEQMVRMSRGHG